MTDPVEPPGPPPEPPGEPAKETSVEPAKKPRWSRRRAWKWGGIVLASLLGVLLLAAVVLYVRGHAILRRTYDTPGALSNIPTDAGSIARGQHVLRIHGCQDCHGERLEGKLFLDIPPGRIVAPNLTRGSGGIGSHYSAVDWDRAIRYGVRPNGRAILPFMPYDAYNRLNDADAAALASYLSSLPAVDNQVPESRLSVLGYVIFGMQGMPREGFDAPRPIIAPGVTPEYGAYLASTTCVACHGDRLQGAQGHGDIPAPGLLGYAGPDAGLLVRALRTGVAADGRQLDELMPWRYFAAMSDTEILALHAYLRTLAERN
jgi:mono/diheme cytochrome c family protein